MTDALTLLKLLAAALAFMGLCGAARRLTRLPGAAAPLLASCGIMLAMTLGGMAGALNAVWIALMAGGLIAFAWRYIVRRTPPDWPVLALALAFAAYGVLHFRNAAFTGNDSASHWGLMVKFMLREGRLPDESTRLIYFPTYPPGAGTFIYFFARCFGEIEGGYMAAQLMLDVFGFMPVFALVRRNRAGGWALGLGALVYLLAFDTKLTSLQVDVLLSMLTIGGMAMIHAADGDRQRRLAVLPVIAALPFVKASGIAFAALLALMLGASRSGKSRRAMLREAALGLAVAVAAFALWQLHVRLAFGDALRQSKHAVSLGGYAQALRGKDGALVKTVALGMLRRLALPERAYWFPLFAAAVALGASLWLLKGRARDRALWLRRLRDTALGCVVGYLAWYALLFAMYMVSMPADEARELLSIDRYEGSGVACVLGAVLIFLLRAFCAEDSDLGGRRRPAAALAIAMAGMLALFGNGSLSDGPLRRLTRGAPTMPTLYRPVAEIAQSGRVESGRRYLVFTRHDQLPLQSALYAVKYYFYTNDIVVISGGIAREGYDYDGYYRFRDTFGQSSDIDAVPDLAAALAESAAQVDYILVCAEDPAFEAALAEWGGDVPVEYGV